MPFSRGPSRPRHQTRVSCIAGKLFTVLATRENYSWGKLQGKPFLRLRRNLPPVRLSTWILTFSLGASRLYLLKDLQTVSLFSGLNIPKHLPIPLGVPTFSSHTVLD